MAYYEDMSSRLEGTMLLRLCFQEGRKEAQAAEFGANFLAFSKSVTSQGCLVPLEASFRSGMTKFSLAT